MATQTVRTIYEAQVSAAQQRLRQLAGELDKTGGSADKLTDGLKRAGNVKIDPQIDLDIAGAEKEVQRLTRELNRLKETSVDPAIKLDIAESEAQIRGVEADLDRLDGLEASPIVDAETARAEGQLEGLRNRIQDMEGLRAEAGVTVEVDRARTDLADAENRLKALQGRKAEMIVTVDAESVDESLDGVGDAAEDAGGDAGKRAGAAIMDGLSNTPIVGAVAGLVAAVGIGAVAGIKVGLDAIRMEDLFGARLGLDDVEARKLGIAAGAAYSNAWGDSIQDNLGTAQSALENALVLPDSTGREIQGVIEQLTAVSELLGSDITETAEAAGNMIKNGLAKDATEAFDIIVAGQQNGLNRSEDWLDTLREYSGMFESIGLSGAEAGGLIEQAMDAGARNSDVAADALKEFSIRAQDDSKTSRAAFEAMGEDADKMGSDVAKGGDTATAALDTVLDGLRGMTDEQERNQAGVDLFGTMWEDAGNGAAILAMDLDGLGDAWVNVGDTSANAMDRMSDNAATKLESAKRDITTAATTLLGGLASTLDEEIGAIGDYVTENSAEVLGFLIDLGGAFFDVARAAVEFGASSIEVFGDVSAAFAPVVRGIADAVVGLGALTGNQDWVDLGNRIGHASNDMEEFGDTSEGMADTMRTEVGGALDEAEAKFNDWTGPALMQAEIDDAVTGMVGRLDEFVAYVDELPGGTITINGEATEGEEALNKLLTEVDESNGTVDINGETVGVEDAMDRVMELAAEGVLVEVTANTGPTEQQITDMITGLQDTVAGMVEIPVGADTTQADTDIGIWGSGLNDVPAKVFVEADLYGVEATMEAFYAEMMEQDWTVDINGETVDAQQALGILLDEVNNGSGTVTINGMTFPADTSLMALIEAIQMSEGTVTIDGDPSKANSATAGAKAKADGTTGTIDVEADTSSANSSISTASRTRHATIDVNAETANANRGINNAARDRRSTIRVSYSVVGGVPQMRGPGWQATGAALGARLPGYGSGYASGYGVVPGPSAPYGVDNVLWPSYAPMQEGRATGGPILSQPLAGGEWVVNPVSSKQHDNLLSAINAGATRTQIAAMAGGGGSSGPSTLTLDGAALGALASAVQSGASRATIAVGHRQAAELFNAGFAHSERLGGLPSRLRR